ncbi:hypothetical protein GPECTOR_47g384 [Gonium pectorale]|uniref:IPT/TIG domain-containing protein n=1 Tax=Gonium pectorale TaxID=33097 RepID=A0A150G8D3_GONPE|nr:hypothetical protein GPECTOR_47g384 [Gonium pectorale]|eukprot:KXZ46107.1 hypothetical protein GPECTOR_47g384 [Gonium pectorale]
MDGLTCETSPGLSGTYWVNVTVSPAGGPDEGADVAAVTAGAWGFTYTAARTPVVRAVRPAAGPPGSRISVIGDPVALVTSDCGPTATGDSECLDGVWVGAHRCGLPLLAGASDLYDVGPWRPTWGDSTFAVNCTVPQPERNNPRLPSRVPGLGVSGPYNVTPAFAASSRGGRAAVGESAWMYTADGVPYMYGQYAQVFGVSPPVGSTAGGTLVTITGRGFPRIRSPSAAAAVRAVLAGAPCAVQESTYDKLTCVTSAPPSDAGPKAGPVRGLYPGMRGAQYELVSAPEGGQGLLPALEELWWLAGTAAAAATTGASGSGSGGGNYSGVLMGRVEGREEDVGTPRSCARIRGFFTAPRAAAYTFYASDGDFVQLNGSWRRLQDDSEASRLVLQTSYSLAALNISEGAAPPAGLPPPQPPMPVSLAAGQPLLLELTHCSVAPRPAVPQLSVRVATSSTNSTSGGSGGGTPLPQPPLNSAPEVQRVRVATGVWRPPSIQLSYLYSSAEPVSGLSWSIGLNGWPTVSVRLAATAPEIRELLASRLGSPVSESLLPSGFGVRRALAGGSLTLEVAVEQSLLGRLDVTSPPRIVALPPLGPVNPAATSTDGCQFANPLAQPLLGTRAQAAFDGPPTDGPALAPLEAERFAVSWQALPRVAAAGSTAPRGAWRLSAPPGSRAWSGSPTALLAFNATAEQLAAAVRALTGVADVEVSHARAVRQGSYLSYTWNVTFLAGAPAPLCGGHAPPSGTVRVSHGSWCEFVELDVLDDPEDVLRVKLSALPGVSLPRAVRRTVGNGHVDLEVRFDPVATPGDLAPLRVADTRGLCGEGVTAAVVTDADGSADQLFQPLPADLVQLPVGSPGAVQLAVGGIAASCASAAGHCAYAGDAGATPVVASLDPEVLLVADAQGTSQLHIRGQRLAPPANSTTAAATAATSANSATGAANVTVTIGGVGCPLASANDTDIVCQLASDALPAGAYPVEVRVPGRGYAAGAPALQLHNLAVFGMEPRGLASEGASLVRLFGRGFAPNAAASNSSGSASDGSGAAGGGGGGGVVDPCSRLRLQIGGVACGLVSCGAELLTALYPGIGGVGPEYTELPVVVQVLAADGSVWLSYQAPEPAFFTTSAAAILSVSAAATNVSAEGEDGGSSGGGGGSGALPATGGTVGVVLSAAVNPSAVEGLYLVPQLDLVFNGTAAGVNTTTATSSGGSSSSSAGALL